MRKSHALILFALSVACLAQAAGAAEVNLNAAIVGAFPVGTFADKDNIIYQAPYGWSARGGGAGTGLGFNLEVETRVGGVTWVGFRFGYLEYSADAGAAKDFINSKPDTSGSVDEITELEASWTNTFMSFPVRFVARDFKTGSTYLKLDIGWAKVATRYEGTMREGDPGVDRAVEAEFKYGNQFFLAAGIGADYRVWESLAILAELKFTWIFTWSAETTAAIGGRTVRSELNTDIQSVDLSVGVRLPVGGI
ncbi:MAG: outer membrane beta-barrel protein [bacterium]|jgi:hypothetical protein